MKKLLFATLLLTACHPQEGDVYENLLTRERIQIDRIGVCGELEESYDRITDALIDNSELSSSELLRNNIIKPPALLADDREAECFAYEEFTSTEYGSGTLMIIEEIEELEQNYTRIN